MFSIDELGLIAYLNDNALTGTNRMMTGLPSDMVGMVLDRYLSRDEGTGSTEGDLLLAILNDRKIGREALARTAGRVKEYLENGIKVITYWDSSYPGNLRLSPDPPLVLYVTGNVFPGSDHVAILGTSNPSKGGLDLAYEFGAKLAKKGRTVVTGLSRGIDAQALEGAIGADGTAVAVLGTPLSDIYPDEIRLLAAEVSGKGAVISELTEEADLHPGRFLQRNRMICGMSGSVVVIESSGVEAMQRLIEQTIRQGRRAYIVDQEGFEEPEHGLGLGKLSRLGATPITSPNEFLSSESRQDRLF
ncbi:MAG: DNA-processing protein DprA [Methanomassiliicoccus sp.]|nr:DNA-processing protein DprA [Methanomassiliicoccus sp.]